MLFNRESEQMTFSTKFDALSQSNVAAWAQGIRARYISVTHRVGRIFVYLGFAPSIDESQPRFRQKLKHVVVLHPLILVSGRRADEPFPLWREQPQNRRDQE